eukprot:TRINITY_DN6516_c0_g1_i2.p1 TRINITY_DN6516_c0_g1~~TRINITY_DN6516_c0_g1_i2.p1  ORF type:complete len:996 (+),score=189.57 TRINITY_DN6516_c0_g1_i2:1791-4778(+)
MRSALAQHNTCLRALIKAHDGYEVKTEGDAFMVAFTSAADGYGWAMSIQSELVKHPWPGPMPAEGSAAHTAVADIRREGPDGSVQQLFQGIRVRCGLHTGMPDCQRDPVTGRMDYFGPMVNLAARVSGVATGGQCVVSGATYRALRRAGIIPSETIALKTLGQFSLKGVRMPETIFSILPAALAGRFDVWDELAAEKKAASPESPASPGGSERPPLQCTSSPRQRQKTVEARRRLERCERTLMGFVDECAVARQPGPSVVPVGQVVLAAVAPCVAAGKKRATCGTPAWRVTTEAIISEAVACGGLDVAAARDAADVPVLLLAFWCLRDCAEWAMAVQHRLTEASWPPALLTCPHHTAVHDATTGNRIFRGVRLRVGIAEGKTKDSAYSLVHTDDSDSAPMCAVRRLLSAKGGEVVAPLAVQALIDADALQDVSVELACGGRALSLVPTALAQRREVWRTSPELALPDEVSIPELAVIPLKLRRQPSLSPSSPVLRSSPTFTARSASFRRAAGKNSPPDSPRAKGFLQQQRRQSHDEGSQTESPRESARVDPPAGIAPLVRPFPLTDVTPLQSLNVGSCPVSPSETPKFASQNPLVLPKPESHTNAAPAGSCPVCGSCRQQVGSPGSGSRPTSPVTQAVASAGGGGVGAAGQRGCKAPVPVADESGAVASRDAVAALKLCAMALAHCAARCCNGGDSVIAAAGCLLAAVTGDPQPTRQQLRAMRAGGGMQARTPPRMQLLDSALTVVRGNGSKAAGKAGSAALFSGLPTDDAPRRRGFVPTELKRLAAAADDLRRSLDSLPAQPVSTHRLPPVTPPTAPSAIRVPTAETQPLQAPVSPAPKTRVATAKSRLDERGVVSMSVVGVVDPERRREGEQQQRGKQQNAPDPPPAASSAPSAVGSVSVVARSADAEQTDDAPLAKLLDDVSGSSPQPTSAGTGRPAAPGAGGVGPRGRRRPQSAAAPASASQPVRRRAAAETPAPAVRQEAADVLLSQSAA